ncbi:MAG TPA: SAM-dependent methyltransferase [Myxococcaceae bacterium]|nr:SAM-dependent methyltransferase [Myxococcaceae bacterium]
MVEGWLRDDDSSGRGADGVHGVALTSLWAAALRAVESERPDALFHDPFARTLAGPEGFEVLEAAWAVAPIEAPTVPVRTRFFDQRIAGSSQVVLLAAGMDARAFRLPWPAGTHLFEIDLPEVLEIKRERLGAAAPTCSRVEVATDLTRDWPAALVAHGFRPRRRTVWLVEGLLAYLDQGVVHRLLARLDGLSAPGSELLGDVFGRTLLQMPQLLPLLEFVEDLGAPWRFGTDEPEALLEPLGWSVLAHDLGTVAAEAGRWPWIVVPRWIPGVPRIFLIEATKRRGTARSKRGVQARDGEPTRMGA